MIDAKDELLTVLHQTMDAFVSTKRRHQLVCAILAEWKRLEDRMDVAGRAEPANDAVIQLLRDSFDMVVIDPVA